MKVGVLVMNHGDWQGQQIVPADWISDSLEAYTRSNFNPYDFGYLWWQRRLGDYDVFFAWGSGGQYIMMFPALETVVAITSGPEEGPGSRADRQESLCLSGRKIDSIPGIPFHDEPILTDAWAGIQPPWSTQCSAS